MNPLSPDSDVQEESEEQYRRTTLNQLPIPTEKEDHLLDPWFFKCDDKIVKYDIRELGRWKVFVNM